jgi:hypothetical protein
MMSINILFKQSNMMKQRLLLNKSRERVHLWRLMHFTQLTCLHMRYINLKNIFQVDTILFKVHANNTELYSLAQKKCIV